VKIPEFAERRCLQRKRTKTGYTAIRVTKATRALLARIEQHYDEPLDSLICYMAVAEIGLTYPAFNSALDVAIANRRRGIAPAAR
jgi:hypothetical protein